MSVPSMGNDDGQSHQHAEGAESGKEICLSEARPAGEAAIGRVAGEISDLDRIAFPGAFPTRGGDRFFELLFPSPIIGETCPQVVGSGDGRSFRRGIDPVFLRDPLGKDRSGSGHAFRFEVSFRLDRAKAEHEEYQ